MPNICDPRYGQGSAAEKPGAGGPFAAGKGTLITDGVSAYFEVGESTYGPAPENIASALRPLMAVRVREGVEVSLLALTAWLAQHFPDCGGCVEGFVDCDHAPADGDRLDCPICEEDGKMACLCTKQRGRIVGVPVWGWHVRRQLAAIEHRPEKVRLRALQDDRGSAVLQVSCPRWTYLRMGLYEPPEAPLDGPIYPEGR